MSKIFSATYFLFITAKPFQFFKSNECAFFEVFNLEMTTLSLLFSLILLIKGALKSITVTAN